jgi:hypothetical protein
MVTRSELSQQVAFDVRNCVGQRFGAGVDKCIANQVGPLTAEGVAGILGEVARVLVLEVGRKISEHARDRLFFSHF